MKIAAVSLVFALTLPPAALAERNAQTDAEKRLARHPIEVAEQLGRAYGQHLNHVAYIPSLALVGRLRLADLTNDDAMAQEVRSIAESAPDPAKISGSVVAGYLIFAELGMNERVAFAAKQTPNHHEMSDAVFMGCPILAAAGKYDACLAHLREMQRLCLRDDGIYRHSPLNEAAWGRGNGFPALGLAWTLDFIPQDYAGRPEILASLKNHLAALLEHQDADGMWHQVIDKPESYAEFSCTCMIAYAMLHGMRYSWLDRQTYEPAVNRAWTAIKLRIALDGEHLTGVCTGTGKQKTLEAYFKRREIRGRDDRGGAMALMLSTEMARWMKERVAK